MTRRSRWFRTSVCLVAIIALVVFMDWLGRVEYDTRPSPEVPSRPTAPIFNESEQAILEGRRWAEQNTVSSHQACRSTLGTGLQALGCHRYVTAQKDIPPLPAWRSQPSTRACQAGVRAHWDPILQDMAERGDHQSVASWGRDFAIDLSECNNIDAVRIIRVVHEPMTRLESMQAKLQAGGALSEADKEQLRHDFPLVEEFKDHPERSRYLALASSLFALLGGHAEVFPLAPPENTRADRCAALTRKVIDSKAVVNNAQATQGQGAEPADRRSEPAAWLARQNEALEMLAQAMADHLNTGCPPLH